MMSWLPRTSAQTATKDMHLDSKKSITEPRVHSLLSEIPQLKCSLSTPESSKTNEQHICLLGSSQGSCLSLPGSSIFITTTTKQSVFFLLFLHIYQYQWRSRMWSSAQRKVVRHNFKQFLAPSIPLFPTNLYGSLNISWRNLWKFHEKFHECQHNFE